MIFCLNPECDDRITEEVLLHWFSFQSKCIEKFHAHADLFMNWKMSCVLQGLPLCIFVGIKSQVRLFCNFQPLCFVYKIVKGLPEVKV